MLNEVKARLSKMVVTSTGITIFYQPVKEVKLDPTKVYKFILRIDEQTEVTR